MKQVVTSEDLEDLAEAILVRQDSINTLLATALNPGVRDGHRATVFKEVSNEIKNRPNWAESKSRRADPAALARRGEYSIFWNDPDRVSVNDLIGSIEVGKQQVIRNEILSMLTMLEQLYALSERFAKEAGKKVWANSHDAGGGKARWAGQWAWFLGKKVTSVGMAVSLAVISGGVLGFVFAPIMTGMMSAISKELNKKLGQEGSNWFDEIALIQGAAAGPITDVMSWDGNGENRTGGEAYKELRSDLNTEQDYDRRVESNEFISDDEKIKHDIEELQKSDGAGDASGKAQGETATTTSYEATVVELSKSAWGKIKELCSKTGEKDLENISNEFFSDKGWQLAQMKIKVRRLDDTSQLLKLQEILEACFLSACIEAGGAFLEGEELTSEQVSNLSRRLKYETLYSSWIDFCKAGWGRKSDFLERDKRRYCVTLCRESELTESLTNLEDLPDTTWEVGTGSWKNRESLSKAKDDKKDLVKAPHLTAILDVMEKMYVSQGEKIPQNPISVFVRDMCLITVGKKTVYFGPPNPHHRYVTIDGKADSYPENEVALLRQLNAATG